MPHVEEPYRYEKLPHYPDLRPEDRLIWERFIEKNPDRFSRVWYDVRVGDPAECPDETPENMKQAWADLTRWAIDVVGEDEDAIYVIEVKPYANAKAMGQALAYASIFDFFDGKEKRVIPVVLTDTLISTTQKCCAKNGVELWVA